MSESITNLSDAVAALGAVPVPVGPEPQADADPRIELIRRERTHCEAAQFESEDDRQPHVWGPSQYPKREMCQRCTVSREWAEDPEGTDVVLLAEVDRLRSRVAELESERHVTNEALDDAVQELSSRRDEEPPAADTLPAWLHWRFGKHGQRWNSLDADDQSYWAHHAEAVRRAVARNGFKSGGNDAALAFREDEPADKPCSKCGDPVHWVASTNSSGGFWRHRVVPGRELDHFGEVDGSEWINADLPKSGGAL